MKTSAPLLAHGQNDQRPLVMVTTVVFCLLMMTAVVAKHIVRLRKGSELHHFDYTMSCGALLMLFQTACVMLAVARGLGKHFTELDGSDKDAVNKVRRQSAHSHIMFVYSSV
jgi:hypothetical protein